MCFYFYSDLKITKIFYFQIKENGTDEHNENESGPPQESPPTKPQGFQMDLTRKQVQQYTTQFGFEESEIEERHNKSKKREFELLFLLKMNPRFIDINSQQ